MTETSNSCTAFGTSQHGSGGTSPRGNPLQGSGGSEFVKKSEFKIPNSRFNNPKTLLDWD
jgi:hypothetical protein